MEKNKVETAYLVGFANGCSGAVFARREPGETWFQAAYRETHDCPYKSKELIEAYSQGVRKGIIKGLKRKGIESSEYEAIENPSSKIIAFYFPVPGFPLMTRHSWTAAEAERWLSEHEYRGFKYYDLLRINKVLHIKFAKPKYANVPRRRCYSQPIYSKRQKKFLYAALLQD